MMTPLHHSDYTLKNRAFNCRMRNRYYEEVYYAFRALLPNDYNGTTGGKFDEEWFAHLQQEIKHYERLITTCLEYAQADLRDLNAVVEFDQFHEIAPFLRVFVTNYSIFFQGLFVKQKIVLFPHHQEQKRACRKTGRLPVSAGEIRVRLSGCRRSACAS